MQQGRKERQAGAHLLVLGVHNELERLVSGQGDVRRRLNVKSLPRMLFHPHLQGLFNVVELVAVIWDGHRVGARLRGRWGIVFKVPTLRWSGAKRTETQKLEACSSRSCLAHSRHFSSQEIDSKQSLSLSAQFPL